MTNAKDVTGKNPQDGHKGEAKYVPSEITAEW